MDNIEKARELFKKLESRNEESASKIAFRTFCIQERLAKRED